MYLILANSILENILCPEGKEKIQIKLLFIGSATQISVKFEDITGKNIMELNYRGNVHEIRRKIDVSSIY